MYRIFANDVCIYDDVTPDPVYKVINPKLVMEDSAAGSLELTLPPGNAGYDLVERMNTDIYVYVEGDPEPIWGGRILSINIDFWKRKKLYCEGALAFLNDTIQPPRQYLSDTTTIESFLTDLINIHNSKVGDNRKFEMGMVTVHDGDMLDDDDAIYRYTNYESTLECINSKLVEKLKGHVRVRYQNGVRKLDYLKDYPGDAEQTIEFGSNLLDFTTNFSAENIATVLVPLGESLEESPIENLTAYLTVKDVNDGSIYVKSEGAVSKFGWIEAVQHWDNVSSPETLLRKAQKYLTDEQFDEMQLEIKAVDLHYLNPNIQSIYLLDQIHCISFAHEIPDEEGRMVILNKNFPVTKMEISLDNPSNNIYTLGTKQNLSLTQTTNKINNEILERVERIPSKSSILDAAKKNALEILLGTEGGFVSFKLRTDESGKELDPPQIEAIRITNRPKEEESTKMWIWDMGGLGYLTRENPYDIDNNPVPWTDLGVAMTMDGEVVADFITSGTLKAIDIFGTSIKGSDISGSTITSVANDGGQIVMSGGSLRVYDSADAYLRVQDKNNSNRFLVLGSNRIACSNGSGYVEFNTWDAMLYLNNVLN